MQSTTPFGRLGLPVRQPARLFRLLVCAALAVGLGSALAPASAHAQLRPFARAFTENVRGQLIVAGNSVVTCDRTRASAAVCAAVETGESGGMRVRRNDNTPTAYVDVDGTGGDLDGNGSDDTFTSSRATAAITGQVAWAGLYWWGSVDPADSTRRVPVDGRARVQIKVPGSAGYQAVNAAWVVDGDDPYFAFADVTALVRTGGAGVYTVANVTTFTGTDDHFGGWALVVVDRNESLPLRHFSLYSGYARYGNGVDVPITFSGFLTPLFGPLDAQLALVTLDGDGGTNDSVTFKGARIFNAINPINDVANSTISVRGALSPGREPALVNTLGTDIDVFDVSALLANGDTSVVTHFDAASNESNFAVFAGFVTTLYQPDIDVDLAVADVDGGELKPGDVLEYTATITNRPTSRDGAVKVVFSDLVPTHTSYVDGSLIVVSGPAGSVTGVLSEPAGDDTGEVGGTPAGVSVRVGSGATATTGGALGPGQSVVLRFRVRIDPALANEAVITNQAVVTFEGQTLSTTASSTVFSVKSSTGGMPGPTTTIPVRPVDSDGDGLLDPREREIGTNPQDADSDDDGVLDGAEPGAAEDTDGDGRINALDPDSDNDGLIDGTELGLGCGHAQTDNTKGICRADADAGATKTDPRNRDTDGGSKLDGAEDVNHDGKVDLGETDPNNPADDKLMLDSDGDGLPDDVERMIGSDPFDADSDDDGARDGVEVMPAADSDGDGRRNVLDPDSDNDGLFDGTELGFGCADPATSVTRGFCIPDADMAASRTDPLRPDTDGGGAPDGAEDANHNGAIDAGERNPLDPKDDLPVTPADAGTIDTGAAADTGGGVGGAAGADAGDAGGDATTATDLGSTGTEAEVGVMADASGPDGLGTTDIDGGLVPGADAGVGGAAGAGGTMGGAGEGGASGAAGSGPGAGDPMAPGGPMSRDGRIGGGGCSCEVGGVGAGEGGGTAALAGLVVFAAVFRRRRERRDDARGAFAKAGSK